MNLLAIDTSTDFCSVAACRDETLVSRHEPAGQRQAEMILDMVGAVLGEAGLDLKRIDGIAFGAGPGSFTGLRIAAGVTQGLAFARGVGVVGVGSLLALAEEARGGSAAASIVSCLNARMGEVYHAAYRRSDGRWEEVSAPGLYKPEAVPLTSGGSWIGAGDGFAAYREALAARLGGSMTKMHPGAHPTARAVLKLALPRFAAGEALDAAEALPVYLRDKVAQKTSERR